VPYPKFEILIATRNRPNEIGQLLQSIVKSDCKPEKVVLVSSGAQITDELTTFSQRLKIDHFHTEAKGQVNQKKIGISRLDLTTEWVIFLDDDLLLEQNTITIAFDALENFSFEKSAIVGLGFGLTPTSRLNRKSRFETFFATIFRLTNPIPGSVMKSGQGVSYLESKLPIPTAWLNGASMWRTDSVHDYIESVPSSTYAACEDLVFSYRQSKRGKLVFVPNACIKFQNTEPNDYNRSEAILSSAAWRYFFVKSNSELSLIQLLFSQIGRLIYLFAIDRTNKSARKAGFVSVKRVLTSILMRRKPDYLIQKYL